MRIAQVVNTLEIGGLERMVVDLAIGLGRMGHRVSVICLRGGGPLEAPLAEAGIAVETLGKPEGFSPRTLWTMARRLRRERVEAVHTHNPLVHLYGALGGRMAGSGAVVSTRHGLGNYLADPAVIRKTERIFAWTLPYTDRVVAVCEAGREYFARELAMPRPKLEAIYNGIPLEKFREVKPRSGDGRFRFGTVGRLVPVKGHATLLEAFARVWRQHRECRLAVLGDGALRGELEQRAAALGVSEAVEFRGAGLDVAGFLGSIDTFVLASVSEGLPLTILEAMAAGRAVVATAVGGVPELVEGAGCGFLAAPGDAAALGEALERMRAATGREAMAARGRAWALEHHSLETMCGRYAALYERILGAAGARKAAA